MSDLFRPTVCVCVCVCVCNQNINIDPVSLPQKMINTLEPFKTPHY